jgi:protein ImuB
VKRLACVRLPVWPVQRLRAERPDLRSGPLLVLRRDPRRGPQVVACCGTARRAGVRAGMTLTEATALLPTALRATIAAQPEDPAGDLVALGRLAVECEQFSPRVGWETVGRQTRDTRHETRDTTEPDHLFLDISGVSQLFGGEESLTERLVGTCRELGYVGRVAVAETLGAAWALAATVPVIVPPGEVLAALRPLPVASLRLPAETTDVLTRLGVGTVNDLLRLPRAGLATRFGPPLLLRLDQALGTAPEIIVPHRPPPVFEAAEELEYPTDRRVDLDWVLDGLIDRVTSQLQAHGRGAIHVRGELRCGTELVAEIEVALYRPTDLAKPLRELVRLHCDRLALSGPVDRIRLWADQTIPLRPRQVKLFTDPTEVTIGPLGELLERLSSRLGPAAVVRPVRHPDPLPERAVRWVALMGARKDRGQRTEDRRRNSRSSVLCPLSSVLCSYRPLRLLTPPAPIEVTGDPPIAFRWRGRRHVVARCWGPERIETGWWRTGLVRRDYYRVETTDGHRFWLFRELHQGGWSLHGG